MQEQEEGPKLVIDEHCRFLKFGVISSLADLVIVDFPAAVRRCRFWTRDPSFLHVLDKSGSTPLALIRLPQFKGQLLLGFCLLPSLRHTTIGIRLFATPHSFW